MAAVGDRWLGRYPRDPWWVGLVPHDKISRGQLVRAFSAQSMKRSGGDTRDTTKFKNQVNAFSTDLKRVGWGQALYTTSGIIRMGEEKDEEVVDRIGWASVLDVYGVVCDPLAHYLFSFYPMVHALRPKGLSHSLNESLKDLARSGTLNAFRGAWRSGFDGTPLFESKEHTFVVLDRFAAGARPDEVMHERLAKLAYAVQLDAWAEKIRSAAPPAAVRHLSGPVKLDIVDAVTATADALRREFSDQVPSLAQATQKVDRLLVGLKGRIADARQTRTVDPTPEGSKYALDAYDRTRARLIGFFSIGLDKTERDAENMFYSSVRNAELRDELNRGPTAPVKAPTMAQEAKLHDAIVVNRDALPHGLGLPRHDGRNIAEYDLALVVCKRGLVSREDVEVLCAERFEVLAETRIADSLKLLVANVLEIIWFGAQRSGML